MFSVILFFNQINLLLEHVSETDLKKLWLGKSKWKDYTGASVWDFILTNTSSLINLIKYKKLLDKFFFPLLLKHQLKVEGLTP